jgi:hypothetical protein
MRKKKMQADCVSCGKSSLTRDEIGICQKLLGEEIEQFYCLDCLADYLGVSVEDIQNKIEEFKAEGCKLFD